MDAFEEEKRDEEYIELVNAARAKIAAVTAERDALAAERDNLKARVELLEAYARADATAALYVGTERDALADQLAAIKKRVADAPRRTRYPSDDPNENIRIALLRLEDGEA